MSKRPKVIIMSGTAGSGKSTEAKRIAKENYDGGLGTGNVVICSADDYFVKLGSGEYKFDPRLLSQAHEECLLKFMGVFQSVWRPKAVIIDNTNLTAIEMAPYVAIAAAYGCEIEIVTVICDPKIACSRNVHGVPLQSVERMAQTLRQRELPRFWNVKRRDVFTSPPEPTDEMMPGKDNRKHLS